MTPKKWSLSALAVEFRMDRRTIAGRMKDCQPIETKGNTKYWLMADAAPAVFSPAASDGKKLDITKETARLKSAQANKTELEVEVLKGTLISAEVIGQTWADYSGACRAKFIGIPSKAATQLVGLDVPEAERLLREFIFEALEELTEYVPANNKPDSGPKSNSNGGKKNGATTRIKNK